jgi:hypothetical protein
MIAVTDWVQHHATVPVTTPDGPAVDIDVEIAPLVEQLWRLGYRTKVACQDMGESILHGGTRVAPPDRERMSAIHAGRAWVIVGVEQGPVLVEALKSLPCADSWKLFRVTKDNDPDSWISLTFPRTSIAAATELMRSLPTPA